MQDMVESSGRVSPSSDRARKDLKQKDKKSGMLRGLFNRKEKKVKIDEGGGAGLAKHDETSTLQTPVESGRSSPSVSSRSQDSTGPKRPPAKLVKAPPPSTAAPTASILKQQQSSEKIQSLRTRPTNTTTAQKTGPIAVNTSRPGSALDRAMSPEPQHQRVASPEPTTSFTEPSHRIMSPEPPERVLSPEPTLPMGAATVASRNAFASHSMYASFPPPTRAPPAPVPQGALPAPPTFATSIARPVTSAMNQGTSGTADDSNNRAATGAISLANNIPESSGKTSTDSYATMPSLANTSSSDDLTNSTEKPIDMSDVDPSLRAAKQGLSNNTAITAEQNSATAAMTENNEPLLEWDDQALLHYLDSSSTNVVRDMLLIVQDTAGVQPLPQDHPDMLALGFAEQKEKLDQMSQSLDRLLMDFLARREKVT